MKHKYIKRYKNRRKVLIHGLCWKFSQGIYLIKFHKGLMHVGFKKSVLKALGEHKAKFIIETFERRLEDITR